MKYNQKDIDDFWRWKLTLEVRCRHFYDDMLESLWKAMQKNIFLELIFEQKSTPTWLLKTPPLKSR